MTTDTIFRSVSNNILLAVLFRFHSVTVPLSFPLLLFSSREIVTVTLACRNIRKHVKHGTTMHEAKFVDPALKKRASIDI